jgi:hypothetical protein
MLDLQKNATTTMKGINLSLKAEIWMKRQDTKLVTVARAAAGGQ